MVSLRRPGGHRLRCGAPDGRCGHHRARAELAGPGLEDEFFARAELHDIDGVDVPVVEVSDLVVMKVLADRPKDIEDVVTLLRVQKARIDRARVSHVLTMLESALGQSDLLPAFESALARAERV